MQEARIDLNRINFHLTNYADVWTRDYVPIFVKNHKNELTAVKWDYNAYGEKFTGLIKDNSVWAEINQELNINTVEPGIFLEAGGVEVNGGGTLLTTEQCLLKRNPHLKKEDYEQAFAEYLGITKVIWLKQGLVNDHTDGHIDELAKFVAPQSIVCAYEDDPADPNFQILEKNYQVLKNSADAFGKPFEVIKLPMSHIVYDDGNKAPVSYANFYIGNKVVLASIFNDPNDQKALDIIQSCFPNRKVVGIDCSEIIYGGGAIHCMTQQQPVGTTIDN
jgi:agmatine deiminase